MPPYKLLRKPVTLDELHWYLCNDRMAIWRDKGTLTYVKSSDSPESREMGLSLRFYGAELFLSIVGKTDPAVAETATSFLSLKTTITESSSLTVVALGRNIFDFRDTGSQCLAHTFDEPPHREVTLESLTLSAKQSKTLATRSHPVHLSFSGCVFEDDRSAFVDAIERRQSSFGSLSLSESTEFSDDNPRHDK